MRLTLSYSTYKVNIRCKKKNKLFFNVSSSVKIVSRIIFAYFQVERTAYFKNIFYQNAKRVDMTIIFILSNNDIIELGASVLK